MTQLGKYELLEQLGRGGYGTVYRARETVLDVERAVKVLHPALAADPDFIERFRREARTAARLDHPHIVPVYELDEAHGSYFLVMKYLPGGSLKDLLDREGRLPFGRALQIARQVAAALEFAYRQPEQLVHRDLKPGNILFDADGSARLADFGFAKALAGANSASLSASGGMIGTPAYMPPEIWRSKPASPASDVYSLACVVYEMLTGQVLFAGDSPPEIMTKHVLDGPQFPAEWPEGVPQGIAENLSRAMAREPGARHPDSWTFTAALARLEVPARPAEPIQVAIPPVPQAAKPAPTRPPAFNRQPVAQPAPRRAGLPTWAWIVGGLAGLALLVVAVTEIGALFLHNQRQAAALTRAAAQSLVTPIPTADAASQAAATETAAMMAPSPTPAKTPTQTPLPSQIVDAQGVAMVLIPAGSFEMGSDADASLAECQKFRSDCERSWFTDEEPVHTVTISRPFYMDIYEVTNAQYAACVAAGECSAPSSSDSYTRNNYYNNPTYDNYPVIYVNWNQASEYCAWRDGRLPTEAEYEYAARGGLEGMNYPWGNTLDGSQANYCDSSCSFDWHDTSNNDGYADTAPVGSYSPNGYGLYDMAGNVWEWVNDWYDNQYYQQSPSKDPPGPSGGEFRVLRGGSWYSDGYSLRVAIRNWNSPDLTYDNIGFRCSRSP